MHILGLETSGRSGTIAIVTDGQTLADRSLSTTGRRHAQTLILETQSLLRDTQIAANEIDVVAISQGPGSFTGLRVGAVFAKTFCYATQAKLVAVDTLQCIAERVPFDIACVHVIEDAQRGDVFANAYHCGAEKPIRVTEQPTRIVAIEEFVSTLSDDATVSGPAVKKFSAELQTITVTEEELRTPRAETVAIIGHRLAILEDFTDPWDFEPFYLRKSAAEEKRDATLQ